MNQFVMVEGVEDWIPACAGMTGEGGAINFRFWILDFGLGITGGADRRKPQARCLSHN